MSIQTFKVTLAWAEMISPKVRHFAFRKTDNTDFSFTPGQFVTMHFLHQDKMLKRSYSIATISGKSPHIEFAANYVPNGPGTELLFSLKPNDEINLSGPHGKLVLPESLPNRCILIGTSTGITPYRCMLPLLSEKLLNPNFKLIIIQGVQSRQELLYKNDFLDLANKYANFTFRAHYSRESAVNLEPYEFKGYVQYSLQELAPNPSKDIFFLCGNPNMIDDTYNQLIAIGFQPQQIRREKYFSR